MQELTAEFYFSLEAYLHKEIFEVEWVWDALKQLEEYLRRQKLGKIEVDVPSSVHLIHPELISIGEGTVIEPGAYIQGPVVIGPRNMIRHGAYIRGNVLTGENCIIGHSTEVKHSIFLNHASAAHFNYVGDSILGNRVNLGAGTKLANYRLDHQDVHVRFQGKKIPTGLKKLGAIIGDGAQLGCNAVANPGTLIAPKTFCYPLTTIKQL